MLFSILMANFNNSRFLAAAVQSVFEQTYTDWELIIVDDGSTDEFGDVIKAYSGHPRIRIYRNGINNGCSFTKRKLLDKASGKLAAFLDPDDTLHPDALQTMVDAHMQRPEYSIIHSTHYICDDKLNIIRIAEYPKALPENTPYLLLNDGSIHAFASFKKACYDKTPGLSPFRVNDRAIDQELYYILEEQGKVLFIDRPLYYYRIHKGSISNVGNEVKAMIAHYTIVEEQCLKRIRKLQIEKPSDAAYWIRRYRTRYHKIRIINSVRKKQWLSVLVSAAVFPFVGGMENLLSYARKLPKEGLSLMRRSFVSTYKIVE